MLAKSAAIKHGKSGYFISTKSNFKLAAFCIYLLSLDANKLTFSQNNYYFWWPTLWTLKYFLRDMQAIPICLNKCITLLGDPPDIRIPKLSRKFPTGIFLPRHILLTVPHILSLTVFSISTDGFDFHQRSYLSCFYKRVVWFAGWTTVKQ